MENPRVFPDDRILSDSSRSGREPFIPMDHNNSKYLVMQDTVLNTVACVPDNNYPLKFPGRTASSIRMSPFPARDLGTLVLREMP